MRKDGFLPMFSALAICVAACLWGVDAVVLRPRLVHLDVGVVVFWEHILAFSYMAFFLVLERRELSKIDGRAWGAFVWVALFGGAVGTYAITKALFFVGFVALSVSILVQKLQPVFAILLAMAFLKERPERGFFRWALLAVLGSYLVTFGFRLPHWQHDQHNLQAAGLGLLAAFAWGSSTVLSRRAIKDINFRVATYLRFGITSLLMGLFLAGTGDLGRMTEITSDDLTVLLIVAISTGGVALFFYYFGLKSVPASKATLYELFFPLTTIVLDYFMNGQLLTFGQIAGSVVLLYGIHRVVTLQPGRVPRHRLQG